MSDTAEPKIGKNEIQPALPCRLYLVTPAALDPLSFSRPLAEALDAGDVACLQLRLKDVPDDQIKRSIDILMPIAVERDVAFILNDRPDIARAQGCDGVHIGQTDAPYEEARRLVGPDRIVGVTCHDSRHLAVVAAEEGADYVAFGAFYPTRTKPSNYRPQPELLSWWNDVMTVPSVAIGGITPENSVPLVTAGADFIAVVSGVWDCPDGPGFAVKAYNRAITENPRSVRPPQP